MATKKPKIVFTAPKITEGFMAHDIALLSPYVDVIELDLSMYGGFRRLFYFVALLRALLREQARAVLCFFVMPNYTPVVVTLARVLGRKVIIVTGGIDATYVPDIGYGAMGHWLHRRLFAYSIRLAHSVLPFSNSSRDEILRYSRPSRVRTAYLAIDTELFRPGNEPRARRAVTACYSISPGTLRRKGIDTFIQAAALLPDVEFVVVGSIDQGTWAALAEQTPPNVRFTMRRYDRHRYARLLQTSAVYVQASAHEGFGVSLAEAMSCGCVPVVTDRYALPEVVGDTGYLAPFGDPAALAQAIQEALDHPEKGEAAHQRAVEHFPEARRQRLLREELELILGISLAERT